MQRNRTESLTVEIDSGCVYTIHSLEITSGYLWSLKYHLPVAKCLNSQCLLEWQTFPDHSSVPSSNLRGLLPQYIEDRRHQFPAYLLYPSLWWWFSPRARCFSCMWTWWKLCKRVRLTFYSPKTNGYLFIWRPLFFLPASFFKITFLLWKALWVSLAAYYWVPLLIHL